jgi:hypothetical protein
LRLSRGPGKRHMRRHTATTRRTALNAEDAKVAENVKTLPLPFTGSAPFSASSALDAVDVEVGAGREGRPMGETGGSTGPGRLVYYVPGLPPGHTGNNLRRSAKTRRRRA